MNCPICHVALQITERSGIEIDYCPKCRGVWVDRGELDKIIERSERFSSPRQPSRNAYDNRGHRDDHYYHKKKKHKSRLSEIFDF
jgi:hypothetical protein